MYIFTALPKPPTSLITSDVTANSVKLSWNPGNVDPIDSYILKYRSLKGGSYNEIADITKTEYNVMGLQAYTEYEFRVIAVNNIGRGIPSRAQTVRTGELGMWCLCLVVSGTQ